MHARLLDDMMHTKTSKYKKRLGPLLVYATKWKMERLNNYIELFRLYSKEHLYEFFLSKSGATEDAMRFGKHVRGPKVRLVL